MVLLVVRGLHFATMLRHSLPGIQVCQQAGFWALGSSSLKQGRGGKENHRFSSVEAQVEEAMQPCYNMQQLTFKFNN